MPSSSKLSSSAQAYFQFKASFSPCVILEILRNDFEGIKYHLAETVRNTPHFFIGSPIIIDLGKIKSLGIMQFTNLKELLLSHGMIPVGTRGGSEEQQAAAIVAGLPLVNIGKFSSGENNKHKPPEYSTTKLVTSKIRSGMQVYVGDGDLIVTAQVSPGAELIADGHIHVYGCLRGRALAGIHGNKQARIFCLSLEAELISIAGYYLTRDEIPAKQEKGRTMQIYLNNDELQIETL